jgi:hypothetical protein
VARVYRTDFAGTVRGVEATSTGGLRVPAAVTRKGVLRYADASGRQWAEYRPPEEVFAPESLATLRAAAVTDRHPTELVTAETWEALAKGHVDGAPERDGDFVVVDLAVQAAPLCALVQSGESRECSSGYTCDVDPTPGITPEGERYDAVQRAIRYNHIALGPVGWGRAGRDVSLRMDGAAYQVLAGEPAAEGTTMKRTLKIRGRTFRLDEGDEAQQKAQADEAQAAVEEVEMKADEDAGELAALQTKLAEAQQLVSTLQTKAAPAPVTEDTVPEDVLDSALELRATARAVLGAEHPLRGKKAPELRREVVAKALPAVKLDGRSDAEIAGMFRVVATQATGRPARNDALGALNTIAHAPREDSGDPVDAMQTTTQGRWREPTTITAANYSGTKG